MLGNFAILFIKEKDIPSFLTFPQVLYVELSRPIYENALTGIDASCFPDYNIVTGRNVNATTIKNYGKVLDFLTKKGKGIVPYSFLYSSCSTHMGLALKYLRKNLYLLSLFLSV